MKKELPALGVLAICVVCAVIPVALWLSAIAGVSGSWMVALATGWPMALGFLLAVLGGALAVRSHLRARARRRDEAKP
jgi:hypothetical protein